MGGMIKRMSAAMSKLRMWTSTIMGPRAGYDLGVAKGEKLYFDADQLTPNDYIFAAGTDLLDIYTAGVQRVRVSSTVINLYKQTNIYGGGLSVPDGQKIDLEGPAGDTYIYRQGGFIRLVADNNNNFSVGSALNYSVSILANTDNVRDLGDATHRWLNLYASHEIKLDDGAGVMLVGLHYLNSGDGYIHNMAMANAQKLAMSAAWGAPEAGRQVYDTTLNQMSYWNAAAWVNY